jgi:hypothetical protein
MTSPAKEGQPEESANASVPHPTTDNDEGGTAGKKDDPAKAPEKEIGGRGGPDPTRYGDWEINGRCVDF